MAKMEFTADVPGGTESQKKDNQGGTPGKNRKKRLGIMEKKDAEWLEITMKAMGYLPVGKLTTWQKKQLRRMNLLLSGWKPNPAFVGNKKEFRKFTIPGEKFVVYGVQRQLIDELRKSERG
jgi:hypothetical protein